MKALTDYNVALIGCGRMGSALVGGAVKAGAVDSGRLFLIDTDVTRAQQMATDLGGKAQQPPAEPTLWVVAVKPQYVAAALAAAGVSSSDLVVSVAAGITTQTIRAQIPAGVGVVRTMPNTPALVGAGITGVLCDPGLESLTDSLFGAVGRVVHLTAESQFDAVTAVSGSGPAYVFVAIEALADGGVAMGLPREMALELALHTVLGAAMLAESDGAHPAELKDRVASPGGTTIAGLAALERAGFRSALIDAVRAAAERSRELGE